MAVAVAAAKKQLRQELKRALAAMTAQQRQEESAILTSKTIEPASNTQVLASEEYRRSKRLSIYLSMPTEVDTHHILEDALKSGKVCYVPRYDGPDMEMLSVHSLDDVASLPLTSWNIPQPASGEGRENSLTSGQGLDLILVPGLGFSESGLRIGRGKGYYDSYLTRCIRAGFRPKTLGLGFLCQRYSDIPTNDQDFVLDRVLFPDSVP